MNNNILKPGAWVVSSDNSSRLDWETYCELLRVVRQIRSKLREADQVFTLAKELERLNADENDIRGDMVRNR